MKHLLVRAAGTGVYLSIAATTASAAENFYVGKSVDVIVPSAPGGSYDLYARLVGKNLGGSIPGNPGFVARNMPGGGGVTAANHLYNRAARDGSVIGGIRQELALEQILGNPSVRYNALNFGYIGRTNENVAIHVVRHDVPIRNIEDVRQRAVITGAEGVRALPATYPRALNRIIGTKWKIVTGYKGGAAARLAFEKGEVEATVGPAVLYKNRLRKWLENGIVHPVVQYSPFRYQLFPDVPTMVDLARNDEEKKVLELIASTAAVGRSFVTPPEVPRDRLEILRTAFADMTKDEQFLAAAKKRFIDIQPLSGANVLKIIEAAVNAPAHVIAQAKAALSVPEN